MNFKRLPFHAPVGRIMAALKEQPDLFELDTFWKDYPGTKFKDVDTIYLRFPDKRPWLDPRVPETDPFECFDQAAMADLGHEIRPVIFDLMREVEGERLGRVMINKLAAGGKIDRHSDTGGAPAYYDRFHIALSSNDKSEFICGDESLNMRSGETWWVDYTKEHEVHNRGTTPRVHLIADIKTRGVGYAF